MQYVAPGKNGSPVEVKPRYENFIGGRWVAPSEGRYRVDLSPATAEPITEVADSTPDDVGLALDGAHAAKDGWGAKSAKIIAVDRKLDDVNQSIADVLAGDIPARIVFQF